MTINQPPSSISVAESLLGFLLQQAPELGDSVTIDSNLTAAGVDSFSLIELVLFIERQFQIKVPLESLTPQKAESLASLGDVVMEMVAARTTT